jgi:hypothetical protein
MNVQLLKWYSLQGLARAVDIYNGYTQYTKIHKVLGYRFLLEHGWKEPRMAPTKQQVVDKIITEVDNCWKKDETQEANSNLMDWVDLLMDYAPEEGEQLLEKLRELKTVANEYGPCQEGPKGTIYADSQSAHNTIIKDSVIKAATKLVRNNPFIPSDPKSYMKEKMELYQEIKDEIISLVPDKREEMDDLMERIEADNATYGPDKIMCDQIFLSLYLWIGNEAKKGKNMSGIQQRLIEELLEMTHYCSSRILTGLINVMQGFTDDPDYCMKIDLKDQCKAVIYNYINKCLQECEDEEVLDGMLDYTPKYLKFVKDNINKKMFEWKREYGDDWFMLIKPVVNEYVKAVIY